jgi:predicted transcriptional regulator
VSTEFSADSERYLEQAIAGGTYRDRAQAIDEAIVLLKRRDQLRSDVRAAIEQADSGKLLEADAVFARLTDRARQIEAAARA